jgi:hypothetical protein
MITESSAPAQPRLDSVSPVGHNLRMRGPHRALAILLIGLAAAHLAFARAQPTPVGFGDEEHYNKVAARDLREGTGNLLPGGLRSAMRPELAARVFSHLGEPGPEPATLIATVTWLHVLLLLSIVALTYQQARVLGLSDWGAFAAAAMLGLFPWFGVHVHTLWPELIHSAFVSVGLLALFAFARGPRLDLLVLAGVALGYAQLTKSAVGPFALLAVVGVGWSAYARSAELPSSHRLVRGLLSALILAAALTAVLVPQMRTNEREGFGFALGANRWWNLELALRTPVAVSADDADGSAKWELQRSLTREYMAASKLPLHREQLASGRARAFVSENGWARTAAEQLQKFLALMSGSPRLAFYRQPVFEQSLGYRARWGEPTPGWIAFFSLPSRQLWYLILFLGLVGLALRVRRDRVWLFPAAFVLCGLLLVMAVPIKFRFVLPVVPGLCLGVGAFVDRFLLRAKP